MPADDNQNQNNNDASLDEKVRSGSLPFADSTNQGGVSMTSGIGADESMKPEETNRPRLSEPGLPPLPDIEEAAPPPPPSNLPEPGLQSEGKNNEDLGAKGVGMVSSGDNGDKPLETVKPKSKGKTGLIVGVMALLLLVAGAGVAVLNFDLFRGDIRQRAFNLGGEWFIGGYPEQYQIDQYDRCNLYENWCDVEFGSPFGVGQDSYCWCEGYGSPPGSIGCTGVNEGKTATAKPPIGTITGAGNGCPQPTPTTPAAICGNNICDAGELCENGANRSDYSGTGDPGSWQCLSSDIGKAPSGVRVGECRFPGSPFGAPYCAQSPSATSTPTPTPTPVAMCIEVKGWVQDPGNGCVPQVGTASGCIAGDWKEANAEQLGAAIEIGDTVRFTVKGGGGTFSKARFSVNDGAWVESTNKYGALFYYDYAVTQSGPISVKAELWR